MPRINFQDLGVANEAFGLININVRGVQLDGGELNGFVEATQVEDAVFMGSFMSHRSLFTGARMPGMTPFCWMRTGDSFYQAGPSYGGELCGFNDFVDDTHCAWTGNLEAIYLPTEKFKGYCLEVNALKALDRLESLNRVPLSLSNLASVQRQFRAGQDGKLTTSAGLYGFIATLLEEPEDPPLAGQSCKNDMLLKQFVQIAHDHADDVPPLQLSDVYKMLPTTRSTLAAATREAYGLGPKELMRRVRLEQCRMAFLKPTRNTQVESTMRRYGFTNRKAFADHYKAAFMELPSAALQRGYGQLRIKGI